MAATVMVERLAGTPAGRSEQMARACAMIGLSAAAQGAKAIFIKPNLTFPHHKDGVTTRAVLVEDVVHAITAANPRLKIFVGEGEGGYNSFSMSGALQTMGYGEIPSRYPNVELVNLTRMPSSEVVLQTARGPYHVLVPELLAREVDFAISCPLAKVHAMTTLTLSYKNLWGCLPDVLRLKNHYMFSMLISKMAELFRFRYAILDGLYGLNRYGPMDGDAIELNWFVAADSLGAFDAVVSRMMGYDWRRVPHLRQAGAYGFVPADKDITIHGDPDALKMQFRLDRGFWTYPAFSAFHSKHLTQLFYLSRYAKFLHDVMYTFRKRDIPLDHAQHGGAGTGTHS